MDSFSVGIIAIVAIIIVVVIASILKNKKTSPESLKNKKAYKPQKEYLYQGKEYFFSKNELYFYRDLQKAIEGLNLVIFAKPRLADIIEPKKGAPNRSGSFTKIRSKHLDFVLCKLPNIKPVIVIELDDASHERPDRKQRDNFVNQALSQSKIPILHVTGSAGIAEKIRTAIPPS
jgi:hypothetical protein